MKNYTIVVALAAIDSKRKIESLGGALIRCKGPDVLIPLFSVDGRTLGAKCIALHDIVDSLFRSIAANKREGMIGKVQSKRKGRHG